MSNTETTVEIYNDDEDALTQDEFAYALSLDPVLFSIFAREAQYGSTAYSLKPFHKQWIEGIHANKEYSLISFRGSLKSTIANDYILWYSLFTDQYSNSILAVDNNPQVETYLGQFTGILDSPMFRSLYPYINFYTKDNNVFIENFKHPWEENLRINFNTKVPCIYIGTAETSSVGYHINHGIL